MQCVVYLYHTAGETLRIRQARACTGYVWASRIRFINKLFVTKLDIPRQKVVYEGGSFDELMAEYTYMCMQPANPEPGGRNVRLVKDIDDLRLANKNHETGLILTIEGAHSLMGKAQVPYEHEFSSTFGLNDRSIQEIYDHVNTLKNLDHHVFFMTLSHMTWNPISPQSKSLDMKSPFVRWILGYESNTTKFRHIVFEKYNNKIVDTIFSYYRTAKSARENPCSCDDPVVHSTKGYGWNVVKMLLDSTHGQHRILIDMRHMDPQARFGYIDYVKEQRAKGDTIPLIVSHAAVNGKNYAQSKLMGCCPFADRYPEVSNPKKFYRQHKQCLSPANGGPMIMANAGWFHPWSINLFDEEIKDVYDSRGIIGITLEERVLGTGRPNYTRAYYRRLRHFFGPLCPTEASFRELKTLEPFMRNLLYIVAHSGHAGNIESWNHVGIGSDFDGMIDPLNVCPTVRDIPHLYALLEKYLEAYARFQNSSDLLAHRPVDVLLKKLFYENGEGFIAANYK